ncbi:hypothetical protein USDA257_c16960 [Sinorhizobium fredii USDA 257]|uniref:Uncharacterized protein n=1 Tax=Sinorhizobium fredii (strain USDA 257) TaxID=1185652 RepID=I3X328_SINF2|nr:hypothetical protein USDA257_c16960 [Sinorhizobium fredii USDA 257]
MRRETRNTGNTPMVAVDVLQAHIRENGFLLRTRSTLAR